METESKLDLALPGFPFTYDKHKKVIEDLTNQVVAVFEKIRTHPENHSSYKIKKRQFFGAHPVSLEKRHIKEIKDLFYDFLVCEKTDGTRYLMYINNYGEVYLSGRGDDFFLINMPLPPSMVKENENEMKVMYIFDGELVIDEREGKKWFVYLLFDAIMFNEELVYDKPYAERLKYCLQFSSTRGNLLRLARDFKSDRPGIIVPQVKKTKQPRVKIAVKDFFQVDASAFIFNKMVPKLPHENDGLIFTRNSKPYPIGATSNIIKWKPPEYNTIDFLVVNNMADDYGRRVLDLYVTRYNRFTEQNEYVLFDIMVVDEEKFAEIGEELDIHDLMGNFAYKNAPDTEEERKKKVIAECKFDKHETNEFLTQFLEDYIQKEDEKITEVIENSVLASDLSHDDDVRKNLIACMDKKLQTMGGNWVIWKIRKDKNAPNAFGTAKNVFNCIFEDIGIDQLENEFTNFNPSELQAQMQAQAQQQAANGRPHHDRPHLDQEPDGQKNRRFG